MKYLIKVSETVFIGKNGPFPDWVAKDKAFQFSTAEEAHSYMDNFHELNGEIVEADL